jgi:subtilisin-like proprotein convertase family protein
MCINKPLFLTLLITSVASCSFGDDDRAATEVDARLPDAPPVDAAVDAAPMERVFESIPSPPTPIPDATAAGVLVNFPVTGVVSTTGLDVQVDIAHTYRGDIRIELLRGSTPIKVLKAEDSQDNADDIKATYSLTPAELGTPLNDLYVVKIADTGAIIVGTIKSVRLTFKVQ